ncbi:MAG: cytochrome P450 [Pirellulaceae bacterium]|nr:cytochrome P450 [Pirellulaceae bacterium]
MKRAPHGPQDHLFGIRTMGRMKPDVLGSYSELQAQYGDAVSFVTGPYRLFIFYHPDQVREVLVTHAKSFIRMPHVIKVFAQWNGNSVLIAEGDDWIRQRRLVQAAFHPRRMENYGRTIVREARRLTDSWRTTIESDGHIDVDVDEAMTSLTLSIICRTMFDSEVDDVAGEIGEAVAVLSEVAFAEMQSPVNWPLWWPSSSNRRKRCALKTLDDVVWRFVRERRADGRDHGDLLSMLLSAVDEESGGGKLTDRQVRDEAMTLMLAGHDTTAAAFDWLWYNLAAHPAVAQRCHDEVDAAVGQRDPELADVDRLPFLVATIKETLRLFPPAIGVFLRQATSDVEIGGYTVPKGQLVTLSSYVTQRDERWFPDAEHFDPERFLPPREEQIPAAAYFPFGAGPRVCIGQGFAMVEMTLVAAAVLQTRRVTTIPGEPAPEPHVTMAMRPKRPLKLRWR